MGARGQAKQIKLQNPKVVRLQNHLLYAERKYSHFTVPNLELDRSNGDDLCDDFVSFTSGQCTVTNSCPP